MNKWILLGFSVLLFCTVAQGLVCKVCNVKLGKYCWDSGKPCKAEEGQYCETTEVYRGSLRVFTYYGCGQFAELCNKTESRDDLMDKSYKRTCCNFNMCNG